MLEMKSDWPTESFNANIHEFKLLPACYLVQVYDSRQNVRRASFHPSCRAKTIAIYENKELNMSRKCPTCEKTVYMGKRSFFAMI